LGYACAARSGKGLVSGQANAEEAAEGEAGEVGDGLTSESDLMRDVVLKASVLG
jgi:hypothetical protein